MTTDYSKNNLDITHYRNGDPIPEVTEPKEWKNLKTGAWCYYDNDPTKGILYNWFAVNDPRGLAPEGYYIPNDKKMDSLNLIGNPTYNGYRYANGSFDDIGNYGVWWSSSEYNTPNAWYRALSYNYGGAFRSYYDKRSGFSVRCLRDVNLLKCKDCNDLLENCTCIENTIDMKQETLEEAAERLAYDSTEENKGFPSIKSFINGAKWQMKRSYSEEEVYQLLYDLSGQVLNNKVSNPKLLEKWFEQFKKK